ncbi:MAG: peptide deformylase [Candidatus Uhrbacteria bacterium]|nr:peptide deformylase [Candidatus Uhrbacteria bacterium]
MIRTVLHDPNPELRIVSQPVAAERILSTDMPKLIKDLLETMEEENGVGIAAPQIGVHERIIIAETDDGPRPFFNPEITERSFKMVESEEGCLSVPGKWGFVKRHRSVTVTAKDDKNEDVVIKAEGLLAIIFQHEIDHLDGILFIDRAEKMSKASKM